MPAPAFWALPVDWPLAQRTLWDSAFLLTVAMFSISTLLIWASTVRTTSLPPTAPARLPEKPLSPSLPSRMVAVAPLLAKILVLSTAFTWRAALSPLPLMVTPETSAIVEVLTSFQETLPAASRFTWAAAFFCFSVFSLDCTSALPLASLAIVVSASAKGAGAASSVLPSAVRCCLPRETVFSLLLLPWDFLSRTWRSMAEATSFTELLSFLSPVSLPALLSLPASAFLAASPAATPAALLLLMVLLLVAVTLTSVAAMLPLPLGAFFSPTLASAKRS